ncbi:MAG: pyruvate kinase [Pseudomonadota bacterium]
MAQTDQDLSLRRGRSAKIVATLGPGSRAPDTVKLLAQAGVDIFRLNFSHGSHADHKASFDTVRAVEDAIGRPLAVLADLQGPKIRVGSFPDGGIRLGFRQTYSLIAGEAVDGETEIPVPHPEILAMLQPGDEILLNDGQLQMTVLTGGEKPTVRSELPGKLTDKKGFTVRGKALPVGAMTDKDRSDLAYAMEIGVDIVALSFVQTVEDIREAKSLIAGRAPLVAKIEKPAAIENLAEIVEATDAVMVARGDLGVEFPLEQVPVIQRRIIREARWAGRPVIVATQMLESMIEHAAPTRAEASDVSTAIYQGADAVMLSAETAVGRHPATAVAIMDRIIKATESAEDFETSVDEFDGPGAPIWDKTVDVVAEAVHGLAVQHDACAIALRTGSIARLARFSRVRGTTPILYGSIDRTRLRQAQLLWGVHPFAFEIDGAEDWADFLANKAGHGGCYAYARWRGGAGMFAWEIGASAYSADDD